MAGKAAPKAMKKKAVSKGQANAVANFLKQQKGGSVAGAPAQPKSTSNPVATADDDNDGE
jgi:hypothetical protein